ncbi:MAG TPA: GNAT family N-acetyltransferase [Trueperaceae bacterium]|nr:GNAT family N-acetyltransferase [Trueperaceae bacterium]
MIVRSATPDDANAVRDLLAGIYREGGAFVGDGAEGAGALAARIGGLGARSCYVVAVERGDVVGWLELHRSPARRLEHVAVLTLAVAPRARRRGAAHELLRAGYAWCRQVGVLKVALHVRAGNAAAVRLYESEGFSLEGREVRQVQRLQSEGGGFEDNLVMGKWLSDD